MLTQKQTLKAKLLNALHLDGKNVCLYGYNRSHFRGYIKAGSGKTPFKLKTPLKDTLVPCIFAVHVEGGGVVYRSAKPVVAPRRRGIKLETYNVDQIVMYNGLLEVFIPFCQAYGIRWIFTDCGCEIFTEICIELLKAYNINVYPRARLDNYYGGKPAYSPRCSPCDEIVFPNFAAMVSKHMKTYEFKRKRKSTMQYLLYKNIPTLWNSGKMQSICRASVPNQAKVLQKILQEAEYSGRRPILPEA